MNRALLVVLVLACGCGAHGAHHTTTFFEPPRAMVTEPPTKAVEPIEDFKQVEEVPVEVLETWHTDEAVAKRLSNAEELSKAIEAAVRSGNCMCAPGDPMCSCL